MLLASRKVLKVNVDLYYYVQHPKSWVHLEGRVYNSEAYIGCMVVYLEYLTKTRRRLAEEGTASAGLLEAMQKREAEEALSILTNKFRFASIKANNEMIGYLRRLGYYPIRRKIGKYDRIRTIANIYPLWMAMCCFYHLIPYKLSNRVVSLLLKKIQ